jgi:hypothetical protein
MNPSKALPNSDGDTEPSLPHRLWGVSLPEEGRSGPGGMVLPIAAASVITKPPQPRGINPNAKLRSMEARSRNRSVPGEAPWNIKKTIPSRL